MRKSTNCKAQISTMCGENDTDLCVAFCRFLRLCFVSSRESERERHREREGCDVIDITLKSRVIMHMITSTACRPYAWTRSEHVKCSSACKDKELGA